MSKPRLPAEWEAQDAVQLTWPHADNGWPGGVAAVEQLYVELVSAISAHQQVIIAAYDKSRVEKLLAGSEADDKRIQLYELPSNDCWVRDHGPIGVETDSGVALLNFTFNGWGNKYPCEHDNASTVSLAQRGAYAQTPVNNIDFVLEGGSLESNGVDTLLTTSRCLLNHNRNGQRTRDGIDALLHDYFGSRHILWLDHGAIAGDDTDGHIDMLARFTDENTIMFCESQDPVDENHAELELMRAELQAFRNTQGEAYRLVPLPMPAPVHDESGQRLPASYANFLIINGAVLVPIYEQDSDQQALQIIQSCFPDRDVQGINCLPLIHQYGSLHCASMQIMAGVLNHVDR